MPIIFAESYPQALAGQQETLLALLDRAREAGIQTTVLAPGKGIFVDRLHALDHDVDLVLQPETIGTYGGAIYNYSLLRRLRMSLQLAGYLGRLLQYLRAKGGCVVFCNDLRGLLTVGLAARLAGIPVLIWDKLDKPHGFFDTLQLPLATRNLMIAHGVAKKYPSWQKKHWPHRMRVVRDGIDLSCYSSAGREDARSALGFASTDIVLAIVGTITERKGHDLLLSAMNEASAQDPRLRLLVIGRPDAASEEFAAQLRATASDTVIWLGYRDDVAKVLPAVDILVSPSRYEGMGRVNVEAMATEIPVIGSIGTGIDEVVIDGETGLLVDPTDTQAFSDAILRLSRSKALRVRMGKNARVRAIAEFDMTKQMDIVVQEILGLMRR